MLRVYVRHVEDCPHIDAGIYFRGCRCPKWVDGTVDNKRVRESAQTRSWTQGEKYARQKEGSSIADDRVKVALAVDDFMLVLEKNKKVSPATLKKYRVSLRDSMNKTALLNFCADTGIEYVRELTLEQLSNWQLTWKTAALASQKRQEQVRSFFKWMSKRKWIAENPALDLDSVEGDDVEPTLPFEPEELQRIFTVTESGQHKLADTDHSRRVHAFVLTMRWSGLRISDVVKLSSEKLLGGKLYLYQTKSRRPVYVPLPPKTVTALEALPLLAGGRYFWSGEGKLDTATGNWRRTLRRLFKLAKVPEAHPHRFRDSFACYLLEKGVPMEEVSMLLGHKSIKITEKHYASWVKIRQDRLESNVMKAWDADDQSVVSITRGRKAG